MFSVEFIDKYQTLIGSTLGPFLAFILSLVYFGITTLVGRHRQYRENLRRIEISTTRSIDSFIKSQEQLRQNIDLIRGLADNIEKITNEEEFCLDRVNFSLIREIYRDDAIPNFKIKSYYLHNKLLWVDAGIKEFNEINKNIREDFKDLIRTNELLISLIRQNKNPDPRMQKISYVKNLRSFTDGVEKYIKDISKNLIFIIQANIYNGNLRKRYGKGLYFRWKNEGTIFKYFKNKKEKERFAKNLDLIERIDENINKEVEEAFKKIDGRIIKIKQKVVSENFLKSVPGT